jgi:hypothetical protein
MAFDGLMINNDNFERNLRAKLQLICGDALPGAGCMPENRCADGGQADFKYDLFTTPRLDRFALKLFPLTRPRGRGSGNRQRP